MNVKRVSRTLGRSTSVLVIGLLLASAGCERSAQVPAHQPPPPPKTLTIITPHNERIRNAFSVAFSNWHAAQRGPYVRIDWIVRGTAQCATYIEEALTLPGEVGPRQIPAIMFGGGIGDHRRLAERGYTRSLGLDDVVAEIPAEVGGLPTRDPQGRWFATGLSGFGIVYNERVCAQRAIDPPSTWVDLADPRYRGWVALADPAASGSNRQCLMLILQSRGWENGWSTIMRILANARALVGRSAEALTQVRNGVSVAAFAVNFDGLMLAEATSGAVKYVNPPGATAITPDVISVLTSAGDVQLAEDFVRYCLSEKGQALWGVEAEQRAGFGRTLYHYPLDPKVYQTYAGKLAVKENPLETEFGLRVDLERAHRQVAIFTPLIHAACGDNHVLLQQAWAAVIEAGQPPAALAELGSLPFDEQAAYELGAQYEQSAPDRAQRMLSEWSAMFRAKYQRVLEMVRE
jgi:ABC-type Fe3+ transport system substrate-binding protein